MIERETYTQIIISRLVYLKSQVELSNPLNLLDINIYAENFYRDFLNLLYGFDLKNINISEHNTAAIDLGDLNKRIAIQVTSTSGLPKIRKTVKSFNSKQLYKNYDRLIVLTIGTPTSIRDKFVEEGLVYKLNTKNDIWSIPTLLKDIHDLDIKRLKEVCEFLKNEIKYEKEEQFLQKEIVTFLSLIELLSDENNTSAGLGYIEEPDPEGKIYHRFADHSDFLVNEYQSHYSEYGQVYEELTSQEEFGQVRLRRLGNHLKSTSDLILTECAGDVKQAFHKIVKKYEAVLQDAGVEYDEGAIKFFLIYQLISCNVFPNKVEI